MKRKGETDTMAHDPTCIFCKIVDGQLPSSKVYEDEHVYAFLDLGQVTKGHTLVIPKVHEKNVYELSDDVAAKLFSAVPKIARAIKKQFAPIGMNLLNNNEEPAMQTVFHYHIHLIPRYGESDGFGIRWNTNETDGDTMKTIADTIAAGIE
ncbi:MAG TPA: HIT family protein [Bacillales bacterium]|nr:HIT family protein [Bacillales bacterium]